MLEVRVMIVVVIWIWMEGNWWSIDASGSLNFISTVVCCEAQPYFIKG